MTATTLVGPAITRPPTALRLRPMVVLDGHELDDQTLLRIRQIVRISGGDLVLLRPLEPRLHVDALEDPLTEEAARAEARRYLLDVARQFAHGDINVSIKVTTGLRSADAVAQTAQQHAADLVVLVSGGDC
jgi:nucleotide-binding universal stress UspA family protein